MKKFFTDLISDDNQINEQAFVGVISFFAMVFVLLTDVIIQTWTIWSTTHLFNPHSLLGYLITRHLTT